MRSDQIRNLFLFVVSFVTPFLIFEIALRLAYGNPPIFLYPQAKYVPVAAFGHKLVPNQKGVYTFDKLVETNSFGFRDREWRMVKPAGQIRIMCLGDSLTFGNGMRVEDSYPKVLERKLKEANPNVEVLSAAVSGWATYNEVDFFVAEGIRLKPDIAVVGFFPNDFRVRPRTYDVVLNDEGRWEMRPLWLRWLPYKFIFLMKRSATVVYLRNRIASVRRGKNDFVTQLLENKIDLNQDDSVRATLDDLRQMKKVCDEKKIKMVLASIPPVNSFWFPKGSFRYNELLKKFCESNGIVFVDLADGFWGFKDTNKLYLYPWDNHLSSKGHELVARRLDELIITQLKERQDQVPFVGQ